MICAKTSLLQSRSGFLLIELLIALTLISFFGLLLTLAYGLILKTHKATYCTHEILGQLNSSIIQFKKEGRIAAIAPGASPVRITKKPLAAPTGLEWIKKYSQKEIIVADMRVTTSGITLSLEGVKA